MLYYINYSQIEKTKILKLFRIHLLLLLLQKENISCLLF